MKEYFKKLNLFQIKVLNKKSTTQLHEQEKKKKKNKKEETFNLNVTSYNPNLSFVWLQSMVNSWSGFMPLIANSIICGTFTST